MTAFQEERMREELGFKKIETALYKLQCIILAVCGIGMVTLLTVNGLSRYLLHMGIIWGDEITRVLFVWGCFIGITNAFIHDNHIGFDSFARWKPWTLRLSRIVNGGCLIVVGYVVVYYGFKFIRQVGRFPLPAAGLPIGVMYAAGVLAGGIWLLIGIAKIIVAFKTPAAPEEGGAQA